MWRVRSIVSVASACFASLLLYALAFGCVVDRPLSLGYLQQQLDAKLEYASAIAKPKLVILAGSNGPYSHRCEVIEPIVGMPCVNGGIAVGIGLDYLFARWKPLLHPGDLVYLPMEEEQYVRTRAQTGLGPDASIMFRHDWRTLATLPPWRWFGALFSFDPRAAVMGILEWMLHIAHFHDPRVETTGTTNAQGDHVGHTAERALLDRSVLATVTPHHVNAAQVRVGYGSALIKDFVRWATANSVRVIGGLPTEFADSPMPGATMQAIRSVYLDSGAAFLELPNLSRYPRVAFFDSADHLNETWQIVHSKLLAARLRSLQSPIAGVRPDDRVNRPAPRSMPTD